MIKTVAPAPHAPSKLVRAKRILARISRALRSRTFEIDRLRSENERLTQANVEWRRSYAELERLATLLRDRLSLHGGLEAIVEPDERRVD